MLSVVGQLDHADEYILYPENFGADMSLDETCLSNGDVYTILTTKPRMGQRALAANGSCVARTQWR